MTNELSLRVNAPFVKYVIEQEQKKMTKPQEPKRSIFERIDDGIGLTWLKKNVKKYTGISYLSKEITKAVDDGDDNKLSIGERLWEGVKGAGKAVENFIGSQGLAFMGAMALGSYLAGLAGIGMAFNVLTKGFFLFQGTKLAVKGTKEFVKADTKEEAREGATTAATGGIMLYGTVKGIVKDVKAYNAAKADFRANVESSRATLGIEDGEVLTEVTLKKAYRQAAIKNHPDKGGSEAAMAEVTAAFEFLSKNMKSASKIKTSAVPAPTAEVQTVVTPTAQPVSNPTGEMGLVLASHYNSNVKPLIIPLNPVLKTTVQKGTGRTVSIETGVEIPTTVDGMRAAIENATDIDVLRSYRSGMKHMPPEIKALYIQREQFLRENLLPEQKAIVNSADATEEALKRLPLDVLRNYTQIAQQLHGSEYIDIKLEVKDGCILGSMRFNEKIMPILEEIFDEDKETRLGLGEIPPANTWINDVSVSDLCGNFFIYTVNNSYTRGISFRKSLMKYSEEEYESYIQVHGNKVPKKFTRYVPQNELATFFDNRLKPLQADNMKKWYGNIPDNYIMMMQTFYIAYEFDKFIPELLRTYEDAQNTKKLKEQELITLMNACLSGDYSNIPTSSESATNKQSNTEAVKDAENKITFKDVGGQDEAIQVMKRSVLFPLLYPEAFKNNSIKHGFILSGPPGTGKSLMAEALSNESGAYFIKVNANELSNKYVGQTEENWRNLFKEASEHQPAIIFMDEFDAIAKKRDSGDIYGDDALNQILALISDVEKKKENVYFIGATNRPDRLDDAIKRWGRFGKEIVMTAPNTIEKVEAIFNIHSKNQPLDSNLNRIEIFEKLLSIEATGADIAAIVYEASEFAKERNHIYEAMENRTFTMADMEKVTITQEDFNKAIEEMAAQKKTK